MFMSNGFMPLISKGTRFDNKNNNTVTCIDQFWCNLISSKLKSGVFTNTSSDHQPIFALLPSDNSAYIENDHNENHIRKIFNVSEKTTEIFSVKLDHLIREQIISMDNTSTPSEMGGTPV